VVAQAIGRNEFSFLGVSDILPEVDWSREYHQPLWTYHLHYFEYATDVAWAYRHTGDAAPLRRLEALVDSWMTATEGGRGPGWEPYVISQRALNWIVTLALVSEALSPELVDRMTQSLVTQVGVARAAPGTASSSRSLAEKPAGAGDGGANIWRSYRRAVG
jgi:uncharacterized heparinase superfamily protein